MKSPCLDLLEVNEEFEDLEADAQAEGREAEGGPQEEASVWGQDQIYQKSDQTSPGRKQESDQTSSERRPMWKNRITFNKKWQGIEYLNKKCQVRRIL